MISFRSFVKQLPAIRDLVRQRDALKGERDALLQERDTLQDALKAEQTYLNYLRSERDSALERLGKRRSAELNGMDTVDAIRKRQPEFDQLRDMIRRAGTLSLVHFGNGYTHEGGLKLQQNPDEFAALIVFLRERRPYTNYLEIGTASGGAYLVLSREVGFTNGFSLDDGKHPDAVEKPKNLGQIKNLKQFIGDSHSEEARRFLEANLAGKLDLAFIDGDHSYEGVWQDLELTLQFSRPGTIVVFHDTIACEGVERAWTESIRKRLIRPEAEYIGESKPLGIGVGTVIERGSCMPNLCTEESRR
jgi:predicted O-methyltransferase YrrM